MCVERITLYKETIQNSRGSFSYQKEYYAKKNNKLCLHENIEELYPKRIINIIASRGIMNSRMTVS